MEKDSSTYLDLVRFTAALIILIVHSYSPNMTGGYLWPFAEFGQTAVMLFFVLSGYVIAYVADNKETSLKDYAFARVSRLYTVVVPAVIITIICNYVGDRFLREEYLGPWHLSTGTDNLRYLMSILMMQDIWFINFSPRNNGPFWSITYEAMYYAMFAALFYLRTLKAKATLFLILMVIAGPTIVLLFPIWLLGVLAYWINIRSKFRLSQAIALPVFFITVILLAFSPEYRALLDSSDSLIGRASVIGDYIDGTLFFLHLIAMPTAVKLISRPLLYFRPQIVYLAGGSFSLYLFHQPLVRVFAGLSPFIERPGSLENVLFVYFFTFLVIYGVGRPLEHSKNRLNKFLRKCTGQPQ